MKEKEKEKEEEDKYEQLNQFSHGFINIIILLYLLYE
jgi:hypothetical protein